MHHKLDGFFWRDASSLLGQLSYNLQCFLCFVATYTHGKWCLWAHTVRSRHLKPFPPGLSHCITSLARLRPALRSGQPLPPCRLRKVAKQQLYVQSNCTSDAGHLQGTGSSAPCFSGIREPQVIQSWVTRFLPIPPRKSAACYRAIRKTKEQVSLFKKKRTNRQNSLQKLLLSWKRNIIKGFLCGTKYRE